MRSYATSLGRVAWAFGLASVVLASSGCGENAILEMTLTMPAIDGSAPRRFAFIQVRRADTFPFSATWLAADDVPAVSLGDTAQEDAISVVTETDAVDVHVRVRFCVSDDCSQLTDASAPEAQFVLEHPFYLGERTRWSGAITEVPLTTEDPMMVDRCQIRGCVQGPDATSYCRSSGTHFCEDP